MTPATAAARLRAISRLAQEILHDPSLQPTSQTIALAQCIEALANHLAAEVATWLPSPPNPHT